jgi:hypothetical protein
MKMMLDSSGRTWEKSMVEQHNQQMMGVLKNELKKWNLYKEL